MSTDIWREYRYRYTRRAKKLSPERSLLLFFLVLLLVLLVRLFFLQIVNGAYRSEVLVSQHYTKSDLVAKRGQIYVTDKGGKRLQLTENVAYFTLFVDPYFVKDKEKVAKMLTPLVYEHFCVLYGLAKVDKQTCVQNIETFTDTELLPEREGVFVMSGDNQYYIDGDAYEEEIAEIIADFSTGQAYDLLYEKLFSSLQGGRKKLNYVGFYELPALLEALEVLPYVVINEHNYVYIKPDDVDNISSALETVQNIFRKYGFYYEDANIRHLFDVQDIRYVRLVTNMNAKLAKAVKDMKTEYFDEKIEGIPLFHGLGLEEYEKRYYPHDAFMSNILGYIDGKGNAHYGIEEYYDEELGGKNGKIIGLATPWIGQVGANSFEIAQPQDGMDIYLTIDPVIQKEALNRARHYQELFRSDSIAITIIDPQTGKVKALVNYPDFNPNTPQEYYKLRPLSYDELYLVEDDTYMDIPIFIMSGETLRQARYDERKDPQYQKYIFENYLGSQVFVDKNIAYPYEPGSIFKPITMGIALDSDALSMYDYYNDPGKVKIGQYTIANVSKECTGDHSFLHALEYSCNVGMVRMAQKMSKYVFYTYLEKLGFGKHTGIELAGEDGGTLPDFNFVSSARFFNNTYGQGILATPLQMAVAYSTLINGGQYIKPTILEAMYNPETDDYIHLGQKYYGQLFKPSTAADIKDALVSVVDNGNLRQIAHSGYSLGGKTGTSEIAFRGKYQSGNGWTNGSFVGMITRDATKYVVAVQVRRPRSTQWGLNTAGKIFSTLADFLLSYDNIDR